MPAESAPAAASTVAVIGAGRLGRVLAAALADAGYDVHGPLGRDDVHPATDIALLSVTDAAIPDAAATARAQACVIGHVSGATGLDDVDFSIHPLQTFTGTETPAVFRGIGAAVDGRTSDAREIAEQLARALGATPFRVQDADRPAYHAASALASNLILPVLDAAEQVALSAGVHDARALLAPLVRRAVDNWVERGASEALTGPIARGDESTVERHRAAIDAATPQFDALFNELVAAARALHCRVDRPSAEVDAASARITTPGAITESPSADSAPSVSAAVITGPAAEEASA
ncbi:DUF2520 domain-containing protein [Microbacterium sp. GXF0217]